MTATKNEEARMQRIERLKAFMDGIKQAQGIPSHAEFVRRLALTRSGQLMRSATGRDQPISASTIKEYYGGRGDPLNATAGVFLAIAQLGGVEPSQLMSHITEGTPLGQPPPPLDTHEQIMGYEIAAQALKDSYRKFECALDALGSKIRNKENLAQLKKEGQGEDMEFCNLLRQWFDEHPELIPTARISDEDLALLNIGGCPSFTYAEVNQLIHHFSKQGQYSVNDYFGEPSDEVFAPSEDHAITPTPEPIPSSEDHQRRLQRNGHGQV